MHSYQNKINQRHHLSWWIEESINSNDRRPVAGDKMNKCGSITVFCRTKSTSLTRILSFSIYERKCSFCTKIEFWMLPSLFSKVISTVSSMGNKPRIITLLLMLLQNFSLISNCVSFSGWCIFWHRRWQQFLSSSSVPFAYLHFIAYFEIHLLLSALLKFFFFTTNEMIQFQVKKCRMARDSALVSSFESCWRIDHDFNVFFNWFYFTINMVKIKSYQTHGPIDWRRLLVVEMVNQNTHTHTHNELTAIASLRQKLYVGVIK